MSDCTHELSDGETAVADGYCPLCMKDQIATLEEQLARAKEIMVEQDEFRIDLKKCEEQLAEAQLMIEDKQLLADKDASPAIIAGYRDYNKRLQVELKESQNWNYELNDQLAHEVAKNTYLKKELCIFKDACDIGKLDHQALKLLKD